MRGYVALGAISAQIWFAENRFFTSSIFYLAATAAWHHTFPSRTGP
jgi:hypothetical protein